MRFLVRIKTKLLESNYIKRMKLNNLIRKRKKSHFYKYKNSIRVVNWLIKLRRLKNLKNPFRKFKRRAKPKLNNKVNINNKSSFRKSFNKFNQLSNKFGKKPYNNYNKKPVIPLIKTNVKRV